jgi:hypothetical protein
VQEQAVVKSEEFPNLENDSVEAKYKKKRADVASHFQDIGTTRDDSQPCDVDLYVATYCVSNSRSNSQQWLPDNSSHEELFDHDLEFCGRKISNLYRKEGRRHKPKKRHQYNSKLKQRNTNKTSHWLDGNITFSKEQKKTRRKKRKKELALDRRTKMENLVIQEETFEPEEFCYSCEENFAPVSFSAEKSGLEFLLSGENVPEELEPELLEFLLDLQDRDVTPEDYERLLQLDEFVATKGLPAERVASLRTDTVSEVHVDDTCGVCMENYVVGETRKILPCGHDFHEGCINTWLTYNSTKCPLDNKEV